MKINSSLTILAGAKSALLRVMRGSRSRGRYEISVDALSLGYEGTNRRPASVDFGGRTNRAQTKPNPTLYRTTALALAVAALIPSISSANDAFKILDIETQFRKQLLPYVEAEGKPDGTFVWISSGRLLFTAKGRDSKTFDDNGPAVVWDYTKNRNVLLFDVDRGQTIVHQAGLLYGSSTSENIEIVQRKVEKNTKWKGPPESIETRYEVLVGPFGEERPVVRTDADRPKPQRGRCPADPGPEPEGSLNRHLRLEHGCLRGPIKEGATGSWVYFRADGKRIDLAIRPEDLVYSTRWIRWLEAYQLVGGLSSHTAGVDSHPTQYLLKPDGRLLKIPMTWGPNHLRTTRAGLIGTLVLSYQSPRNDGIFLWRSNEVLQIAEGVVDDAEVSPDGCRLAYLWTERGFVGRATFPERLRVIDLCKGLGIAPDANPFIW